MSEYIEIHWTAKDREEAKKCIYSCLEKKLTPCAQIASDVQSFFVWKNSICEAHEVKVYIKTKQSLFKQILAEIEHYTAYEVPEVLAIPITTLNPKYRDWLGEIVGEKDCSGQK